MSSHKYQQQQIHCFDILNISKSKQPLFENPFIIVHQRYQIEVLEVKKKITCFKVRLQCFTVNCSSINIALLSMDSILHTVIIITGSILIVLCSYLVLNISVYINGRNPMKDNYSIVTNSHLASSSVSIYITEALVVKCNYVI